MKFTRTFYPKGQPSVTLTVVHVPKLDALSVADYLEVDTNTAYVSWTNFRVLNIGDQLTKKTLFGSLVRIPRFDPLMLLVL